MLKFGYFGSHVQWNFAGIDEVLELFELASEYHYSRLQEYLLATEIIPRVDD
jgi:hypothetical protein